MLRLALFFLVVSLIAALFGFTGISAASAGVAKILFFIAIVIFLVFASVVAILWVGAQDVLAGRMTPGRLVQFVIYAAVAAGGLGELS